jgi:helix-turn-helix protein
LARLFSSFEKVYPQFIEKVELHFPNLTKAELRLFLAIYSGLIKEELTFFLGLSDEGVRKAKYRLKTKINLSEEESIEEFILQF